MDLCAPCHLVWFDLTETARLTGEALLGLIGHMAQAQRLPHELLRPAAGCPRCGNRLKTVHNQSRWGASLQLDCVLHHGAYQSFAQFLHCAACVAALPANEAVGCAQCGATLAISSLAEARHSVEAIAPAFRAHALKPAPQVVMKRLAALDADLPRRREWAASLEAEARARRGAGADDFDWGSLWSGNTNPVRAVLLALAIWFVWWFWPRH